MAIVVPIENVLHEEENTSRFGVRRMMAVLEKQGQIEPLQVRIASGVPQYRTFRQDTYGNEILMAARALGWPTILIVEMKRFEE
jgi:hypothetical protein